MVMLPTRRASQPAAGAARVGIDVALANLVMAGLARVLPSDMLGDVQVVVVILVAAGLGYIGKLLRDKNIPLGNLV